MSKNTGYEELYTFPPTNSAAFSLSLMGTSYCDKDYYVSRKDENLWVFEYIVSGKGTLQIDKQIYHPAMGDTYIVPAFSNHCYYPDKKDPWVKMWFNVSGSIIPSLINNYAISNAALYNAPELETIFIQTYQNCLDNPLHGHKIAALAIHQMIATIANQKDSLPKKSQRLYDYLITNASKNVSSSQMAEVLLLSISQTIRLFRKEWGITPYQFLLQRKMEIAKLLLKSTSKTVKEVSEDLSFKDEYHFATIFKKKTEISPGQFSKKLTKAN